MAASLHCHTRSLQPSREKRMAEEITQSPPPSPFPLLPGSRKCSLAAEFLSKASISRHAILFLLSFLRRASRTHGGNGGIWEGRREARKPEARIILGGGRYSPPSPSFFRSAEEPPSFSGQQNLLPEREGKGKKDYRLVGEAQPSPPRSKRDKETGGTNPLEVAPSCALLRWRKLGTQGG